MSFLKSGKRGFMRFVEGILCYECTINGRFLVRAKVDDHMVVVHVDVAKFGEIDWDHPCPAPRMPAVKAPKEPPPPPEPPSVQYYREGFGTPVPYFPPVEAQHLQQEQETVRPLPEGELRVREIDLLMHRLWTKAVGTEDYDKEEWKRLERMIWGTPDE